MRLATSFPNCRAHNIQREQSSPTEVSKKLAPSPCLGGNHSRFFPAAEFNEKNVGAIYPAILEAHSYDFVPTKSLLPARGYPLKDMDANNVGIKFHRQAFV